MKRKGISKSVRFAIFSRDGYTCRYCGAQADTVKLVIDHVIPVAQGGTNDAENLITSCNDCNAGKGAKTPTQSAPTDADRLRLAQERSEQVAAATSARAAVEARKALRQELVNYWCDIRGQEEADARTISVVLSYVDEFGFELVAQWIEIAHARLHGYARDYKVGMYISGIRRRVLAEQEERAANAELLARETGPVAPIPARSFFESAMATVFPDEAELERREIAEAERQEELRAERQLEAEEESARVREILEEQERLAHQRLDRLFPDPRTLEADD